MHKVLTMALAVRLCSADMSCGFIPVEPVLGNRDELIEERLTWYREWLQKLVAERSDEIKKFSYLLTEAVELTCADIVCDAIAIAPILYDRNDKIVERLLYYFHTLQLAGVEPEADSTEKQVDLPQKIDHDILPITSRNNKKKKKIR